MITPDDFVARLQKAILEDNLAIYRELFDTTKVDNASDPYWIRALSMYAKLDGAGRAVLLEIIRQVMADTISNVFAILDGVSDLESQDGDFRLTIGDSNEQLNGELQDQFLALEEERSEGDRDGDTGSN